MYMRIRGIFDCGARGDVDWITPFARNRMVRELHYTQGLEIVEDQTRRSIQNKGLRPEL